MLIPEKQRPEEIRDSGLTGLGRNTLRPLRITVMPKHLKKERKASKVAQRIFYRPFGGISHKIMQDCLYLGAINREKLCIVSRKKLTTNFQ